MVAGRARSGSPRRTLSRRMLAALVACLVVTGGLTPIVAGDGLETGARQAIEATTYGGETVTVDEELLSGSGTVEVVVRLADPDVPASASGADVERRLESHAARTQEPLLEYAAESDAVAVESTFWLTNAVLLEVDAARVDPDAFAQFDAVEAVHENFELSVPVTPTTANASTPDSGAADADRPTTWGVARVDAPAVWERYGTRGAGTRVAVLDTGVDVEHPDIDLYTTDSTDPTYPGGWAEFDETGERVEGSTPHDAGTHGTHVSGTVAGGDASGTQIGVAPDAQLLHGQVLTDEGGTFAQLVAGMEWAVDADADVVTLSLGATGHHHQLIEPVRNAREGGVVVVSAIGNEGEDTSGSPANVYEAIGVGAVNENGDVPSFSGGERIDRTDWAVAPPEWPDSYVVPDVVAPGVAVESAVPGGGYERMPGTSMATPHVAGTIALLLSVAPDATVDELERALTATAWKPDAAAGGPGSERDPRYGDGVVDASAAAAVLADRDATPAVSDDPADTETDPAETGETRVSRSDTRGTLVAAGAVALAGVLALLTVAIAVSRGRVGDR